MDALAALVTACLATCVMFCSSAMLCNGFLETALCEVVCIFYVLSLPCVRLLAFYFWQHMMLLTWRDNNTTGSLHLCHVFSALSVIMISEYIHIRACYIYNCYMYRWWDYEYVSMFAIGHYLCGVSPDGHILLLICIYMNIVELQMYFATVCVLITSLHCSSLEFTHRQDNIHTLVWGFHWWWLAIVEGCSVPEDCTIWILSGFQGFLQDVFDNSNIFLS